MSADPIIDTNDPQQPNGYAYSNNMPVTFMRLQEHLVELVAIPRTLTLLTTRLAGVDATPIAQARALADQLRRRHRNLVSQELTA